MTGTFLNVSTVLLGGAVGAIVGERLPDRFRQTVMHAIGLMTLLIGFQMALGTRSAIIVLGSVVIGALLGEATKIDDALTAFGDWVEGQVLKARERTRIRGDMRGRREDRDTGGEKLSSCQEPSALKRELGAEVLSGSGADPATAEVAARKESLFSKGFVTAALVFCVGPMTILGSFQDGLTGVYDTLAVKSVLDGFTAIALASSLGWGVVFSSIVVLVYQGALTLGAVWAKPLLSDAVVLEMTAAGGLLIVGIGLNILGLMKIRVANMLPALIVAPLLVMFFGSK